MTGQEIPTRIPVTLITGFLGSGKTTLLSKVLSHPEMKNTAVIVNEFGEIGLDHLLISKPQGETRLLSNGCLCCESKGELIQSLEALTSDWKNGKVPAFDRVVIETTGFADPVPVLLAVATDPELSSIYRMDGVVTVADALNIPNQLDDFPESAEQISVADRLLVSKVDLLEAHAVQDLKGWLQTLNPSVRICEMVQGEIDLGFLFDINPASGELDARRIDEWLQVQKHQPDYGHHKVEEEAEPGHDNSCSGVNRIETFTLVYDQPISKLGFQLWMNMLGSFRGPNLLRMKGLVSVEGEPVLIQAVQHLFHPPEMLSSWPDDDERSRLVFITRGVSKKDIEHTFEAFAFASVDEPITDLVRNEGFRRLMTAQSRFFAAADSEFHENAIPR